MIIAPNAAPVSGENRVSTLHISAAGGLTQFGCYIETLAAGATSSHRHWHEAEDEFLLVMDGTATRIENPDAPELRPGDRVCWPAGVPNGHQLQNRTAAPVQYFVMGTRQKNTSGTTPITIWASTRTALPASISTPMAAQGQSYKRPHKGLIR